MRSGVHWTRPKSKPRDALQEGVSLAEHAQQDVADEVVLADDHATDLRFDGRRDRGVALGVDRRCGLGLASAHDASASDSK
jgi:hypothetical protein